MTLIRAVLLTGTIGAGKTTLAEAISEQLHGAGIRHALLDLDWLGQVYPPPVEADPFNDSLAVRNLATVWPNFVATGIGFAVLAATVIRPEQLAAIRTSLPGAGVTVVRITADPQTIARRIERRDLGALREDFLARTGSVAREIEEAALEDFAVESEDGRRDEVAREILDRLGWL